MKKLLIIIALVAIAATGLWLFVPDNSAQSVPQPTSQLSDNPAQRAIKELQNNTAIIFDVRTPEEFAARHITGAQNFNIETIQAGNLPNVPKESTIYVYCRSGNRSNQAKEILESNGFSNVTDLGGLTDLENAGVL